ncbi:MAG: methylenetetrahydrofolate reductase C-terminal domain-containing protein [Candidatus Omnitrophota bacterium]
MIITRQRPFFKILEELKGKKKVFLIGCGLCAASCKTGGEDEVRKTERDLIENRKTVTGWAVLEAVCNLLEIKRLYRRNKKEIDDADAILSMSCGGGAQAIADVIEDADVFTANDTMFQGEITKKTIRETEFKEKCSLCGECILNSMGTICPVTRCPKSLINGPCGGVKLGKCETDKDLDCVWIKIYDRLKRTGKLGDMKKTRMPRDHGKDKKPRSLKTK